MKIFGLDATSLTVVYYCKGIGGRELVREEHTIEQATATELIDYLRPFAAREGTEYVEAPSAFRE